MAQNNDVIDLTGAGAVPIDRYLTSGELLNGNILQLEVEDGDTVLVDLNDITSNVDFGGTRWQVDHTYKAGDIVTNGDVAYIAIGTSTGEMPSHGSEHWELLIRDDSFSQLAQDVIVDRTNWESRLKGDGSDSNSQAVFDMLDAVVSSRCVDADIDDNYKPNMKLSRRLYLNITQEDGRIQNPSEEDIIHGQYGKFIISQGKVAYDGTYFDSAYKFNSVISLTVKPYMKYIFSYEVVDENTILVMFDGEFYAPFGANTCIVVGQSGSKYGHGDGYGSVNPEYFQSGQKNYELSWQADGTFTIRAGNLGDEKINGVTSIYLIEDEESDATVANWDDALDMYIGSNVDFATYLINSYAVDDEVCMGVYPLQDEIVLYNFNAIKRGNES